MMRHTLTPSQAITLQLYSKAIAEKQKEVQGLSSAMSSMLSDACGSPISASDKMSYDQTTRVLTVEPVPQKEV